VVPLFQEASKDAAVANKQLRYGVRFIVVCLLLNRRDTVRRLVRQLRTLVEDYARNFQVSATPQTPCKCLQGRQVCAQSSVVGGNSDMRPGRWAIDRISLSFTN
jgi:hypothetical protein